MTRLVAAHSRGTRPIGAETAGDGVAYMVGIYMQPVRLPVSLPSPAPAPARAAAGSAKFPDSKAELSSDEGLGLSLLDDVLLQHLGDILTQYEEDEDADDDADLGPGRFSFGGEYGHPGHSPAATSRSRTAAAQEPHSEPPHTPGRNRLVIEEVQPAVRLGLGELILHPDTSSAAPARTPLAPSAPYARRRRLLS